MPTGLGIDAVGEEGELRPSRGIVGGNGGDSGDREVDAESKAEFLSLKPARQGSRNRHDLRFSAQSDDGTAGHHQIEIATKRSQQSAQQNENSRRIAETS